MLQVGKVTELSVQKYFVQLKDDLFAAGTTTGDKVFNTFSDALYIRLAWFSMMANCKLLSSTKMEVNHLNRDQSSLQQRMKYLKNKDLLNQIVEKDLHIAWFQILADAAQDWLDTREIEYTENFTNTKSEIIDSDDIMKDFVDGNLVFTNNDKDRVSKQDMLNQFKQFYPDKHLSVLQLISSLKEKNVKYSNKYRINGIQGCFYCVKVVESDEDRVFSNLSIS
jgi:hypothetical protein